MIKGNDPYHVVYQNYLFYDIIKLRLSSIVNCNLCYTKKHLQNSRCFFQQPNKSMNINVIDQHFGFPLWPSATMTNILIEHKVEAYN